MSHILHLRDLRRDLGFESDVWCKGRLPRGARRSPCSQTIYPGGAGPTPGGCTTFRVDRRSPTDSGASGAEDVDYHNITPAQFFGTWVPWGTEEAHARPAAARPLWTQPRSRLPTRPSTLPICVDAACHPNQRSCPPLFDPAALEGSSTPRPRPRHMRSARTGGADWLFVGRVTPSKAQDDLIKALACLSQGLRPGRPPAPGGSAMGDDYPRALAALCRKDSDLGEAVRVHGVSVRRGLAAYYATPDVFVCASEHEGFCVPIVESMALGLPVVAFGGRRSAGHSGSRSPGVLEDKSPLALATAAHKVTVDAGPA